MGLVVAVDGEIGARGEIGFVAATCLTAEVVDGGVFFVAADAGKRQAIEKQIEAAQNLDELNVINTEINI